jgi:hypothetical protein
VLAQTLNREFVAAVAELTGEVIDRVVADRDAGHAGAPTGLEDVSSDALRALTLDLANAVRTERDKAALDRPEQVSERPPPPKGDYAFIPQDELLSLLQTAFEAEVGAAGVPVTARPLTDDRRSGPVPVVTDRQLADLPLQLAPDDRRVWRKMEVAKLKILSDPRWVKSVFAMVQRRIHGRAPWNPKPTIHPEALHDDARILVVGDWGSGLERARNVAKWMEHELDDPERRRRQTHVIHLGDVYYSGEESEFRENFLDPWPVKDRHAGVGSWTLPGNHDMYIGGRPYFEVGLGDRRFAAQQRSSWFALSNKHWQFLGLDSAYEDGGLYMDQASWVAQMRRDHPGRKTVLLTHHQLFSAYQAGAQPMRTKVRALLEAQPIDAWFWGHEHRCLAYRDHERVRFASCVGHGGIPEYLEEAPLKPSEGLVYEYRKVHSKDWQPWITFGFCVLDLEGPDMTIRYVDEDGNEHCRLEHR